MLFLWMFGGCLWVPRSEVEKKIFTNKVGQEGQAFFLDDYQVACPDVLEISVADRAELSGYFTVGADGRIQLGHYGSLRVEGHAPGAIARKIAQVLGVGRESVQVRVAEYKSQHVMLFGQIVGYQRVVPYKGQEPVLDLLQRVGGITKGAAPEKVYVVRTNVFEGKRPEIFHVDLEAIVVKEDPRTNIRLEPFDQIYVGETRQARIEKGIPPLFRPIYQLVWDTRPERADLKKEAREQGRRFPWMVGQSTEPKAPHPTLSRGQILQVPPSFQPPW